MPEKHIAVTHLDEDDMIAGFIAHIKVVRADGSFYWGNRSAGLDAMEMYGMAVSLADDYGDQLRAMNRVVDDR